MAKKLTNKQVAEAIGLPKLKLIGAALKAVPGSHKQKKIIAKLYPHATVNR